MYSDDLQRMVLNWTVLHSGDERGVALRGYIGLSGIADCERVIYERVIFGRNPSLDEHLKFRIGYELEAALIERLTAMGIYFPGETIDLYDGLVQGHTDGVIQGGDLLEIKTIPAENFLPQRGKLPAKTYWQVQAYLHFLKRQRAHVVYLCRDSGLVQVYPQRYQRDTMGVQIQAKVDRLVEAVRALQKPECTCGRCNRGI
jgi:hypothetical protein